MSDLISRQAAIDALWKALYEYEDKTEKQFQESEDLDVGDWILHRFFVQNMSDIDRQTILKLPSAQPEIIRCKDCEWFRKEYGWNCIEYTVCGISPTHHPIRKEEDFCSRAERRTDESN